jgi:DNA-binding CsgD family transcriptional regulator/tetratricopeptide (TPR) repeat protein
VGDLLERADSLAHLESALLDATRGTGRLVFVAGEAGVGKTSLVDALCESVGPKVRVLRGSCDSLFTPRPLGPLADVAVQTGGPLAELVDAGAPPHQILSALSDELHVRPHVLVLEDVHWADEATLDVLRLLGRRIGSVPVLLIATYREEEVDSMHPLRLVLGDLVRLRTTTRLRLEPLSLDAVAELAGPVGLDPHALHRGTGGNPFFVTEVLSAPQETIPETVRDAVLARSAGLSEPGRHLLEAVAVLRPSAEYWLLSALNDDAAAIDECLASGMLRQTGTGVAFRHELARLAVETSLRPDRLLALHQRALAELAQPPDGTLDLERLAHHADAASDRESVLQYAPAAAERAAAVGAHREAASQYERALRFTEGVPLEERARLLRRWSHECYLTDQPEAITALEDAIECYRTLGDARREGATIRSLANVLWCPGRVPEAYARAREALDVLEPLPPSRELAWAYATVASQHKDADETAAASEWGRRALALAGDVGADEAYVHALNTIGTAEAWVGVPGGVDKLEQSLGIALEKGLPDQVGRAYIHLSWIAFRRREYAIADRYLADGLVYASEHGLDLWRLYLIAARAKIELDRGRWDDAAESASLILYERCISVFPRILALVVLALVRARRGDPGARDLLDEALSLAEPTGELLRIAPVAAARAELAWLEGKPDAVDAATAECLELALRRGVTWVSDEFAYWRWKAGLAHVAPVHIETPFALQVAGDWRGAVEAWSDRGCPYEATLALSESDDDAELRSALETAQELGARPLATIVSRQLRERGVRDIRRGPRATTRANPAQLTAREIEVLQLMAQGLRNAEIGSRLHLSTRTVDHHVSAILRKLGVRGRGEAAAAAQRLGLLEGT